MSDKAREPSGGMTMRDELARLEEEELELLDLLDATTDPANAAHIQMVLASTQAAIREAEWHIARAGALAARRAERRPRAA